MLDRRQVGVQSRKERIVAAARSALMAAGPDVSVRRIAADAGLSVATLYNLFGGKEAILVAVLEPEIDAIDAALRSHPELPPAQRAVALVDASLDHFVQHGELFRPLLGAIERTGPSPARTAIMNRCAAFLYQALCDGAAKGDFLRDTPADLVARQVMWSYVQGIRYWAAQELSDAEFRAQVRSALALGLLSVAAPTSRAALTGILQEVAPTLRAISRSN